MFTGFRRFARGQLPIGGLHTSEQVLQTPSRRTALLRVRGAYERACDALMREPERLAPMAIEQYGAHFAVIGASTPPPLLPAHAIRAGDHVYRTAVAAARILADVSSVLGELPGSPCESESLRVV